jgi:hypothetical protein
MKVSYWPFALILIESPGVRYEEPKRSLMLRCTSAINQNKSYRTNDRSYPTRVVSTMGNEEMTEAEAGVIT